jgi:hypothetical protein
MEHRWGQRVATSLAVRLRGGVNGCAPGRLLNVSVSGALIATTLDLPPAARITVQATLNQGGTESLCALRATVVRAAAGVIAVEWLELAPLPAVELLAAARQPGAAPGRIGDFEYSVPVSRLSAGRPRWRSGASCGDC